MLFTLVAGFWFVGLFVCIYLWSRRKISDFLGDTCSVLLYIHHYGWLDSTIWKRKWHGYPMLMVWGPNKTHQGLVRCPKLRLNESCYVVILKGKLEMLLSLQKAPVKWLGLRVCPHKLPGWHGREMWEKLAHNFHTNSSGCTSEISALGKYPTALCVIPAEKVEPESGHEETWQDPAYGAWPERRACLFKTV